MKNKITFYKIKDITTNLYSCGGVQPVFNKRGKTWNNLAHVKSHLTGLKKYQEEQPQYHPAWASINKEKKTYKMRNWKVEEFIFEQTARNDISIEELIIASGLF